MKMPLRPDPGGSIGRKIQVKVNHFLVKIPKNLELIHYDVEITPDVPKRIKRQIIRTMIDVYVQGQ